MDPPTAAATFRTSAEAYDRHVGRYAPELARALCDFAGIRVGDRALDVGCGPGALTTELVARLGGERVAAVDPSPPFAAACQQRLPDVRVEVAQAERLPFADGEFDHVLAQLVVNFMPDAPAGIREMQRVTRGGGSVSAAVWDYGGEMTLLRRFWDAATAVHGGAEGADEGRNMPYCTETALGVLWEDAGLRDVRTGAASAGAGYAGFDDLWQSLERGAGPSSAHVAALAPEDREALEHQLRQLLGTPDGPFRLSARAWLVSGRAP